MKLFRSILCGIMCLIIYTTFCVLLNVDNVFADVNNNLSVGCKSSLLMDFGSGEIVFEKDADKKLPVASIVKLMTILITLENIDSGAISLDDKVITSENASSMGGSQVFIDPYVEYSVSDLLKSVIMASANDASVALAEKVSGSEDVFVGLMNKRANELGLNNTLYANCTGLPAPEQYSCARDCATLLREVAKYDNYYKFSTIWMDELVHPSGRKTELVNTNKLIRYYDGCDSGKTGSTNEAGCCLVASAKKNDLRFIAVTIGANNSKERFKETTKLLNYGFANYTNKNLLNSEISLSNINISKGKSETIQVYAKESYYAFARKGRDIDYEIKINLPKTISAPIKAHQCVGDVKIVKNGEVIKTIELIVKEDIEKISYKDTINKIISVW